MSPYNSDAIGLHDPVTPPAGEPTTPVEEPVKKAIKYSGKTGKTYNVAITPEEAFNAVLVSVCWKTKKGGKYNKCGSGETLSGRDRVVLPADIPANSPVKVKIGNWFSTVARKALWTSGNCIMPIVSKLTQREKDTGIREIKIRQMRGDWKFKLLGKTGSCGLWGK